MSVARAVDERACRIAAAIGDPGRARMLLSLMDDHARTATELAMIANISASTASVHLGRLGEERLVKVLKQGRHRYFTLYGPDVASFLEELLALSGRPDKKFTPNTPSRLCTARTCYDHIAGVLGVTLHERMIEREWLVVDGGSYTLTPLGEKTLNGIGIDVSRARQARRKFASPCLDWSERRFHLGGALAAALLTVALEKKWVSAEPDSRALAIAARGHREIERHFGAKLS
jgi:DNA-binding transcriptional ArsR family regulator